ncbi:MAG TPA: M20 family metallo-hydrolase, partial [Ohtaekwangia sp.]|uniref:M20 family metallo-hydrolase n=1 Tax=Ohtaekwangia sp. TaxID=2066019 RepID=UPI002F939CCF
MDSSLYEKATNLLIKLIAVPSFSKEEDEVASVLEEFFERERVHSYRKGNNVWVKNQYFDPAKPTVLLNSHHDTVKPNPQYTRDPFKPEIIDGKLYGLGSNDAGGPLVSLIATFLHYYPQQNLKYNVMLAATAEEEISGTGGIESIWSSLPPVDFAIVGEPTLCQMATAEKGLMVLDCIARGKAGHAAREEGINAIYEALPDIEWFSNYRFPIVSNTLGPIKMTVTIINAGKQHNVVPAECHYTVDVRVTDAYSLEELLEVIRKNVKSEVSPRSMRMRPSGIAEEHPLVKAAIKLGIERYGSPTTSDQALIPAPSVKMGPGDSARSHTADEFIYADEIKKGIDTYIKVLN